MDNQIFALLKFGKEEHLKSLLTKGALYMNPISHFIKQEGSIIGQNDLDENLSDFFQGNRIRMTIMPPPILADRWKSPIILDEEHGLLHASNRFNDRKINIFSMTACYVSEALNDKKLFNEGMADFGSHFLIVTNPGEFFKRLEKAFNKQKLCFDHGRVEYVNKLTYHGAMGCFRKFNNFKYQNEWRAAVFNYSSDPIIVEIGSLEDIAALIPTSYCIDGKIDGERVKFLPIGKEE